MKYLVDTDVVVDYLMGLDAAHELFAELLSAGACISMLSFSEVYEGIFGSRDPKAAERAFRRFLERVPVLGISRAVAKRNGSLRNDLRRLRRPLTHRAFDILLAAYRFGARSRPRHTQFPRLWRHPQSQAAHAWPLTGPFVALRFA